MKLLCMLTENIANQEALHINSSELADFIWAHDPNMLLKKATESNKGKLVDNATAIEHNSTADNNGVFNFACFPHDISTQKIYHL